MKKTIMISSLLVGAFAMASWLIPSSSYAQSAGEYVRPVPECGRLGYEPDGAFMIENVCNINITVFYQSRGDVSGGTPIGPGEHHRTAYNGRAVEQSGGVMVYSCPGDATPVQPDGSGMWGHYTGREYKCHR